jgi:NAD(P)-dependent dehydrogenase (short-subunit alcohol dehydrogenase family)
MLQSTGQSEGNFEVMHADNPLRRGVEPGNIVAAIRYLADARCVTGEILTIDSGHRFLARERDVQFLGEQ